MKITKADLGRLAAVARDPEAVWDMNEASYETLSGAGLLEHANGQWQVTAEGREFLEAHKRDREQQRKRRNRNARARNATMRSLGLSRCRNGMWE